MGRRAIRTLTMAVIGTVGGTVGGTPSRQAAAQVPAAEPPAPAPSPSGLARVPLGLNFSRLELITTGFALVTGVAAMALGTQILGPPTPSLGPPDPGSFDRRWADRFHLDDGSGGRFLGRVPDFGGLLVLPYLPGLVYGIDTVALIRGEAPILSRDPNSDHRLVAYAETLGWTLLATGLAKVVVGRQRPYVVLDHRELAGAPREANLSFFSGHSAAMFAAASFVALDASRRLPHGPLAGASPARRWLLGRALPYFVAFGTASVVAISRVIDQQHWPSDVLMGSLVGAGIAHLAYLTHFDAKGQPRGGGADPALGRLSVRVAPTPGGVALVGRFP